MEEILASIRRIIADDDAAKTPAKAAEPAPPAAAPAPSPQPAPAAHASAPAPAPAPAPAAAEKNSQDDIDALFAKMDESPEEEEETPEAGGEILELTPEMQTTPPAAFQTIDPRPDVVFEEPAPEPPPKAQAAPPPPPAPPMLQEARRRFHEDAGDPDLMSPSTAAAVDGAFNSLAHTVLIQNARTLDDLVREMLRPMLKAWLDDNLPGMVERLVRAEIERVSRGRG